jgi:hypothetical protein
MFSMDIAGTPLAFCRHLKRDLPVQSPIIMHGLQKFVRITIACPFLFEEAMAVSSADFVSFFYSSTRT